MTGGTNRANINGKLPSIKSKELEMKTVNIRSSPKRKKSLVDRIGGTMTLINSTYCGWTENNT